jgi:hypothetical protein
MAVTLAVHGTLDYAVPALVEQANSWLGPVSAALLLRPDEGRRAVEWLAGWWHCHLRALGVSVHLVWRLPFAADKASFKIIH